MSVKVTTLPNGLRVVSDFMPSVETVSLGVWVGVGARNETPRISGISHLLEHMAFKGTERRSARDIAEEIEAVGGYLNAYTSRENTAFHAKVLKEDAGLAVDIIADILQNSVFDPDELAREQAVVVQEIGQADDTPDDVIFDFFQQTAYPDQPLGWPVLGTAESVKGISRNLVADYMRDCYAGSSMILAAAGRIEHERLVNMAATAFADLPAKAKHQDSAAIYKGGEFREERDLEQVHIVMGFEGLPYSDPDFYAASVLSTLFGGGMSSRLFQEVRESRGLVYSIYSFTSSYTDTGLFGIYAGTGSDEVRELIPVVCDEIIKLTQSIGEEETRRARAQIRASTLMGLESSSSRCEQIARQLLVFGRPVPVAEILGRIESVDTETLLRVARRLVASPMTFSALGPLDGIETFGQIRSRLGK